MGLRPEVIVCFAVLCVRERTGDFRLEPKAAALGLGAVKPGADDAAGRVRHAGVRRVHAPALAVAKHDEVAHAEADEAEFRRGAGAVDGAIRLAGWGGELATLRMTKISPGDGVDDRGGIEPAVGAGEDEGACNTGRAWRDVRKPGGGRAMCRSGSGDIGRSGGPCGGFRSAAAGAKGWGRRRSLGELIEGNVRERRPAVVPARDRRL